MSKRVVILAGGMGSRLGPYTTVLPKPLLPIGDRAILDVVVDQLRSTGFDDITLAVDHLARLIQIVFGDGAERGVRIRYSEAERPLGTAGALRAIEGLDDPFLAMNGDILTTLDYNLLYEAHLVAGNALTIASHQRTVPIDYGVLHVAAGADAQIAPISDYEEKPEIHYTVSMGIYVVSPSALEYVPADEPFDMPDLIQRLIGSGERVGTCPYDGLWLDIGRNDDYEQALARYGPTGPRAVPAATELPTIEPVPSSAPSLRLRVTDRR